MTSQTKIVNEGKKVYRIGNANNARAVPAPCSRMLRDPTPLRFGDDVPAGSIQAGHVNCINYDDYAWSPILAVESFNNNASEVGELGSVESTHGLIRLVSAAPFLYVSGIAATVGLLNDHVTPRVYAQNTVAAHNAAIALAWLLPDVIAALPA